MIELIAGVSSFAVILFIDQLSDVNMQVTIFSAGVFYQFAQKGLKSQMFVPRYLSVAYSYLIWSCVVWF